MAMTRLTLLALVFAGCATTAATPPPAAAPVATPAAATTDANAQVLLDLDRQFAKDSAARGGAAWTAIMAPNAGKPANGGRWIIGPEEIGQSMTIAFSSGFTLQWEPERAQISRGGKLGYTWGRYHSVANGRERNGTYMTVWQKQPDGSWKVLFDTGDPD